MVSNVEEERMRPERELGLVVQAEFFVFDGLPQGGFHVQPMLDLARHGTVEELPAVAPGGLSAVQGGVGVAHQGLVIQPVLWEQGNAHAERQVQLAPLDRDLAPQCCPYRLHCPRGMSCMDAHEISGLRMDEREDDESNGRQLVAVVVSKEFGHLRY